MNLWPGRPTRATVDLDAITHNARHLKQHVWPARLMAVVKGGAYGHGAVMTARAALEGGADWLGVYTVSEGLLLRSAGIEAPILVFGPFSPSEAVALVRDNLTPTLADAHAIPVLAHAAGRRAVKFHLKIDTGMTRAGIPHSDVLDVVQEIAKHTALVPEGVYSHLACADIPGHPANSEQMCRFRGAEAKLREAGWPVGLRHLANSAGAIHLPETRLDMVRTGIALYGYDPSASRSPDVTLRPALQLTSVIARLHTVPAGTGIGYGHDHICDRESRVALVPVGYGDGVPRALGNGVGSVVIGGHRAPIIGRVSMDQITVDVTHLPTVHRTDAVTIIGSQSGCTQWADTVALAAGTISYEILTSILPRVPRLYTRSGTVVAALDIDGRLKPAVGGVPDAAVK